MHRVNESAGLTAPVISADDVIINKQASGREAGRLCDLADAEAVRQAIEGRRRGAQDEFPRASEPRRSASRKG